MRVCYDKRYETDGTGAFVDQHYGDTMRTFTHFIDGQSFAQADEAVFTTQTPHGTEPIAEIPLGTAQTVDAAVASNLAAFAAWRDTNPSKRGKLLIDIGRRLHEEAKFLGEIDNEQGGKPPFQGPTEAHGAADYFEYYGGAASIDMGEVVDIGTGTHTYVRREPFGAVGVITPWNIPLGQAARGIAPALAVGNVVTCKPSEYTSGSTVELARIAHECGLPPGVLNVVLGSGEQCGAALVAHPDVRKVAFTGSVRGGQEVGKAAAEKIIPVTLELGGKSANILFADADLEQAISGSVMAFAFNAGQVCSAGTRLLVERSIHDEVVSRLVDIARQTKVGPEPDARIGAITTPAQYERVRDFFAIAQADGAKLECGGPDERRDEWGEGRYIPITIYSGVTPDMRIAREEIFGPLLSVIPFDDEAQAIAIANDSDYGLAAGLWTQNLGRAHRVAAALEAGYINVNQWGATNYAPFGGYKKSGHGREKGIEALHHYTQSKTVNIKL